MSSIHGTCRANPLFSSLKLKFPGVHLKLKFPILPILPILPLCWVVLGIKIWKSIEIWRCLPFYAKDLRQCTQRQLPNLPGRWRMSCISLPVPYLKWSSSWANFTSTLKFKNSSCTQKYGYSIMLQKYQTISKPKFFGGKRPSMTIWQWPIWGKNAGGFAFCQTKHHWWKSSWYVRPIHQAFLKPYW